MGAKQVWGIILIVLGIFLAIKSVSTIGTANFIRNEMRSMRPLVEKYGGKKIFDADQYLQLAKQQKRSAVIGIIVGISMAIIGTLMLKKPDCKGIKSEDYPDEYDFDDDDNDDHTQRFTF